MRPRFHLAFPVHDLAAARAFYAGVLGCTVGRESPRWIDFDFHGHQITAHLVAAHGEGVANPVDGDRIPVPHFGLILGVDAWKALARRLEQAEAEFIIRPRTRFRGRPGEQSTLFVRDPSGNALEFKAFADEGAIFARDPGLD